jgi:hypothetical protein
MKTFASVDILSSSTRTTFVRLPLSGSGTEVLRRNGVIFTRYRSQVEETDAGRQYVALVDVSGVDPFEVVQRQLTKVEVG